MFDKILDKIDNDIFPWILLGCLFIAGCMFSDCAKAVATVYGPAAIYVGIDGGR